MLVPYRVLGVSVPSTLAPPYSLEGSQGDTFAAAHAPPATWRTDRPCARCDLLLAVDDRHARIEALEIEADASHARVYELDGFVPGGRNNRDGSRCPDLRTLSGDLSEGRPLGDTVVLCPLLERKAAGTSGIGPQKAVVVPLLPAVAPADCMRFLLVRFYQRWSPESAVGAVALRLVRSLTALAAQQQAAAPAPALAWASHLSVVDTSGFTGGSLHPMTPAASGRSGHSGRNGHNGSGGLTAPPALHGTIQSTMWSAATVSSYVLAQASQLSQSQPLALPSLSQGAVPLTPPPKGAGGVYHPSPMAGAPVASKAAMAHAATAGDDTEPEDDATDAEDDDNPQQPPPPLERRTTAPPTPTVFVGSSTPPLAAPPCPYTPPVPAYEQRMPPVPVPVPMQDAATPYWSPPIVQQQNPWQQTGGAVPSNQPQQPQAHVRASTPPAANANATTPSPALTPPSTPPVPVVAAVRGPSPAHQGAPASGTANGKPLAGVVFVLSGYQNPQRGQLRDKAVALGAVCKNDWDASCTHLVCAFPNTPKVQQVCQYPSRPHRVYLVFGAFIEAAFAQQARPNEGPFFVGLGCLQPTA